MLSLLLARRSNPYLRAFCERLIGYGKKPMLALAAIMR